jgi:hypothetical protein
MTKKRLDTVVEDIYQSIAPLGRGEAIEVSDKVIDKFGDSMKEALREWLTPRGSRKPSLIWNEIPLLYLLLFLLSFYSDT